MKEKVLLILAISMVWISCKTRFSAVSTKNETYKVAGSQADTLSEIELLLKPYRDSLNGQMSKVLGRAAADFKKEKPSGSLGNLVADAMMFEAKKRDLNADAGIYNHGGVRINELKHGQITVGKIFELLPFENELVLLEVPGSVLKTWFELILKSGGWPVSKEVKMSAEKESNVFLLKQAYADFDAPFETMDTQKVYRILTNDYVANGGDNCDFLKNLKKETTGKLIRELMIDYIIDINEITPDNQPRIKIQK